MHNLQAKYMLCHVSSHMFLETIIFPEWSSTLSASKRLVSGVNFQMVLSQFELSFLTVLFLSQFEFLVVPFSVF